MDFDAEGFTSEAEELEIDDMDLETYFDWEDEAVSCTEEPASESQGDGDNEREGICGVIFRSDIIFNHLLCFSFSTFFYLAR